MKYAIKLDTIPIIIFGIEKIFLTAQKKPFVFPKPLLLNSPIKRFA